MTIVSAQLDEATFNELKSIALKNGLSVEDCIIRAVKAYTAEYEDDFRADFCAVNSSERAFFLSAGE